NNSLECNFAPRLPSNTIWIDSSKNGNLSKGWWLDSLDVTRKVEKLGKIQKIELASDYNSLLIQYGSVEEASRAIEQLHGKFLKFRRLQVDYSCAKFEEFFMSKIL